MAYIYFLLFTADITGWVMTFPTGIQRHSPMELRHNQLIVRTTTTSTVIDLPANTTAANKIRLDCSKNCPSSCSCYVSTVAHCTWQRMTTVPCDSLVYDSSETYCQNAFSVEIRSIYLSHSNIRQIPLRCFHASGRNLETLDLHNNRIFTLRPEVFAGLDKLEMLDLSDNRLTDLICYNCTLYSNDTLSIFAPLNQSLTSIRLTRNQIRFVPRKSFAGFKKLRVLSLSYNRIRWIALKAFKDLKQLQHLYLRNNCLKKTSNLNAILDWFSKKLYFNTTPSGTYVTATSLSSSSRDDFEVSGSGDGLESKLNSSSPRNIRLKVETLVSVDLASLKLIQVPKKLPKTLELLYLDHNQIQSIPMSTFTDLTSLQYLSLSYNRLNTIIGRTFSDLKHLTSLDLSKNNISHLFPESFFGLSSLDSLSLYGNKNLKSLPKKIFHRTPKLSYLYLQDCGLGSLPAGLWMFQLSGLWLYGNPLVCDCMTVGSILLHIGPLTLDDYKKKFEYPDFWEGLRRQNTVCGSVSPHSGRAIKDLSMQELNCTAEERDQLMAYRRKSIPFYFQYFYQSDIPAAEDNGSTEEYYYQTGNLPENGSKAVNLTKGNGTNKESHKNPIENFNFKDFIELQLKDELLNAAQLTNLRSFDDVIPTATLFEFITSPNSNTLANHVFESDASGDVTELMTSLKSIIDVEKDKMQSFDNRSESEYNFDHGSILKSKFSSDNHWNSTGILTALMTEKNNNTAVYGLHTNQDRDDANVGLLLDRDEYWDEYERNYIQQVSTYDYYAAIDASSDSFANLNQLESFDSVSKESAITSSTTLEMEGLVNKKTYVNKPT